MAYIKPVEVTHYIVVARKISVKGELLNQFTCFDTLSKSKALARLGCMGSSKTTPAKLFEYKIKQKPITDLLGRIETDGKGNPIYPTIWSVPKALKDAYNRSMGYA